MQCVPVVDELVRAPVDVIVLGVCDAAVGRFDDFGRLIARQGREVSYTDLIDQLPVGGAGKGIEICGLDPEKAGERFLLVRVILILNGFENIVRVAAVPMRFDSGKSSAKRAETVAAFIKDLLVKA